MSEFKPVLLTLPSLTPTLALEVLPHGLTIHRIFVQADGQTHDLVVGPEDPRDHLRKKYTNTIVGRYANRIPTGTHSISRDGITSSFTALANESERVSLHGGPTGFDAVAWTPIAASDATLFTAAELAHLPSPSGSSESAVIFSLVSPDGSQGYPGALRVEVLIALVDGLDKSGNGGELALGSVAILYRAKLEDDNVVTPINLTQHWGFNLDASLKDKSGPDALSIKDHTVHMKASHILPLDDAALSTGERIPTTSDPAHNHDGKRVGERPPPGGYDDFYILAPRPSLPSHFSTRVTLSPSLDILGAVLKGKIDDGVMELGSGRSGLKLVFDTNQSGLMFYSNNFADGRGARKKIHGGSGLFEPEKGGYEPFSAAFIEFHEPLAAFLNTGLQERGDDTLLAPGEVYNNWVRMEVRYRRPV